jgi:hypothetical protein
MRGNLEKSWEDWVVAHLILTLEMMKTKQSSWSIQARGETWVRVWGLISWSWEERVLELTMSLEIVEVQGLDSKLISPPFVDLNLLSFFIFFTFSL